MINPFLRATLRVFLVFTILFVLSACSGQDRNDMDSVSKNGEYKVALKSNMLKGLEFRRTEQSTQPINKSGSGVHALSATDSTPATTQHTNEQLYYWPDVTNAVEQMHGIAKAQVFATNKNVYVAIKFTDEVNGKVVRKQGYDEYHRHDVAPRSIAAMPYDHFYEVGQDDMETNQYFHEVGRLVSNYAAPRQVFISNNEQFLKDLNKFVKIRNQNQSLLPLVHDFNMLVQHYFADNPTEPEKIDVNK